MEMVAGVEGDAGSQGEEWGELVGCAIARSGSASSGAFHLLEHRHSSK